jgi:hypothetical protein
LSLGEPFADEAVGYFGLRNAVFALDDTFLEVISPVRDGTSAGRLIERRGGDCGYMLMFQVPDLAAARARAADGGVRTVFEITLDDIDEVHLHPADMHGAIVALSQPSPPGSWRWGGPDWPARAARAVSVAGAVVGVRDPDAVAALWTSILGGPPPGVSFIADPDECGLVEIEIEIDASRRRPRRAGRANSDAERRALAKANVQPPRWTSDKTRPGFATLTVDGGARQHPPAAAIGYVLVAHRTGPPGPVHR